MYQKHKKFFLRAVLVFSAFVFCVSVVRAAGPTPLTGWAYSDTAGWISMNCNNPATTVTFPSFSGPVIANNDCSTPYSVSMDSITGLMSGYAWSDNLGWLRFDPTMPPPTYAENPSATVATVQNPTINSPVVGWARFCSDFNSSSLPDNCADTSNSTNLSNGGWNGWVSMMGSIYGVAYNSTSGDFSGFAWGGTAGNGGGSEVVGYIDFNNVTSAPNTTLPYYPVVSLTANPTTVATGNPTDLTYTWTNSTNPSAINFTGCTPYYLNAGNPVISTLSNWTSATTLTTIQPSDTNNLVQVNSPSTTYYLLCEEVGRWADDPSVNQANPPGHCSPSDADITNYCPKVTVTVGPLPVYYPVIDLTAVSTTIPPAGDSDLEYRWFSPGPSANPNEQFAPCRTWIDVGAGAIPTPSATWINWYTPPLKTPPTSALTIQNYNTWAQAPATTYYLLCRESGGLGRYAIDDDHWMTDLLQVPPTLNSQKCLPQVPEIKNCPHVTVTVSGGAEQVELKGATPAMPGYVLGPISALSSDTLALQWTTPTSTVFTSCEGYSDVGTGGWPLYTIPSATYTTKAPPIGNQGNIALPSSGSITFHVRCVSPTTGNWVISNPFTVNITTTGPREEVKLQGAWPTLTFVDTPILVNDNNDTVALKWTTPSGTPFTTCQGYSSDGVQNWPLIASAQTKNPPMDTELGVQMPNAPDPSITFYVRCRSVINPANWITSNPFTFNIKDTTGGTGSRCDTEICLEIKNTTDADVPANWSGTGISVPFLNQAVNLHWRWNGTTAPSNCVGVASDTNTDWNGDSISVPINYPSYTSGSASWTFLSSVSNTYHISCSGGVVSNPVTATRIPQNQAVASITGCINSPGVYSLLLNLTFPNISLPISCNLSPQSNPWVNQSSLNNGPHPFGSINIPGPTPTFTATCTGSDALQTTPPTVSFTPTSSCTSGSNKWYFKFFEH